MIVYPLLVLLWADMLEHHWLWCSWQSNDTFRNVYLAISCRIPFWCWFGTKAASALTFELFASTSLPIYEYSFMHVNQAYTYVKHFADFTNFKNIDGTCEVHIN